MRRETALHSSSKAVCVNGRRERNNATYPFVSPPYQSIGHENNRCTSPDTLRIRHWRGWCLQTRPRSASHWTIPAWTCVAPPGGCRCRGTGARSRLQGGMETEWTYNGKQLWRFSHEILGSELLVFLNKSTSKRDANDLKIDEIVTFLWHR